MLTISDSVIQLLPGLEPCDAVHVGSNDVLIHAPGFEDRTMAIASAVSPALGARALLLDYRPFNSDNRLEDVKNALIERGVRKQNVSIFEYDRFDPNDYEARL